MSAPSVLPIAFTALVAAAAVPPAGLPQLSVGDAGARCRVEGQANAP